MKNRFGETAFLLAVLLCLLGLSGCRRAEPKVTLVEMTPSPAHTTTSAKLTGDWYGYWSISDTTGDWKTLKVTCWDCCAAVLDEEEGPSLLLWDEDMPRDHYLAKLRIDGKAGRYTCTGGDFLDVPVKQEDVSLQLLDRDGPLLQITGRCKDPVTGSFAYSFFLRPWGDAWPDDQQRPAHYERWYLPESKTSDKAPDKIEVK